MCAQFPIHLTPSSKPVPRRPRDQASGKYYGRSERRCQWFNALTDRRLHRIPAPLIVYTKVVTACFNFPPTGASVCLVCQLSCVYRNDERMSELFWAGQDSDAAFSRTDWPINVAHPLWTRRHAENTSKPAAAAAAVQRLYYKNRDVAIWSLKGFYMGSLFSTAE